MFTSYFLIQLFLRLFYEKEAPIKKALAKSSNVEHTTSRMVSLARMYQNWSQVLRGLA